MLMLTDCPLDTTPFTALGGTTPGPTVGPPGPMTVLPTSAESREISSREDTSAEVRRSFSVVRYSTLAWSEASHAFFRWRHFSAAGWISKCYTRKMIKMSDLVCCVPGNFCVSLPQSLAFSDV